MALSHSPPSYCHAPQPFLTLLTIKPSQKSTYNHGNQNVLMPFPPTQTNGEWNADLSGDIPLAKAFCGRTLIFFCVTQHWLKFKDTSDWPLRGKFMAISSLANSKGHSDAPDSCWTTIWLRLYNQQVVLFDSNPESVSAMYLFSSCLRKDAVLYHYSVYKPIQGRLIALHSMWKMCIWLGKS